jgi:putative acetyltransferase
VNAELLARIQEEASLGGLSHIFPPELYPFPTEAVRERWQAFAGPVRLAGEDGFVAVAPPFLEAIYVRPSAWGTGVAGALHDWAVEQLRAAGVERARLWVLEENHRARRFYERRGWLLDGTTREVPFPPNPIDLGYALALG